jgi:hypothetical protein
MFSVTEPPHLKMDYTELVDIARATEETHELKKSLLQAGVFNNVFLIFRVSDTPLPNFGLPTWSSLCNPAPGATTAWLSLQNHRGMTTGGTGCPHTNTPALPAALPYPTRSVACRARCEDAGIRSRGHGRRGREGTQDERRPACQLASLPDHTAAAAADRAAEGSIDPNAGRAGADRGGLQPGLRLPGVCASSPASGLPRASAMA